MPVARGRLGELTARGGLAANLVVAGAVLGLSAAVLVSPLVALAWLHEDAQTGRRCPLLSQPRGGHHRCLARLAAHPPPLR